MLTKVNDRGTEFVWKGAKGVDAGQPRPASVQEATRRLLPEEQAIANDLGRRGVPIDAAQKLAEMLFGMSETAKMQAEQITFLQKRVNELESRRQ